MSEYNFVDGIDDTLETMEMDTKATSPRPYTYGSISIVDGWGDKGEQPPPFSYSKSLAKFQGWVYTAADKNARAAASIGLRLYVRRRKGRKYLWATKPVNRKGMKYLAGDYNHRPSNYVLQKSNRFGSDFEEIIDDHPLMTLLNQVNPAQNQIDLAYLRFLYLELTGNAYIHLVEGNLGVPEQLYVLPSQWVTIVPEERGAESLIKGYYYGRDKHDQVAFAPDEVIHFRYPNPNNIYYGMGKVEAGWLIINVDYENWGMRYNMLKNNMRFDYAIIMKDLQGNDIGMKRYDRMLETRFKGRKNAGRGITIPGNIQIVPLNWAPRDQGKDDKAILEQIAGVFGIPISELQNNDSNFSNGQTGNTGWWRNTIRYMLTVDEQKLNEQLLPRFNVGEDAFLAYDNCVPEDQALELQKTTVYLEKGVITPSLVAQEEGYPEPKDGDIPLPQLQYELMGRMNIGTTGIGGPARGGTPEGGDSAPREENSEGEESYKGKQESQLPITLNVNNFISDSPIEVKTVKDEDPAAMEDMIPEEKTEEVKVEEPEVTKLGKFMQKYVDDPEHKSAEDNYITKVEKVFTDYFSRQKELVIDYVKAGQKSLKDDLEDMIAGFNDSIVDELQVPVSQILQAGAIEALKEIGLSSDVFDVYNPEVSAFVRSKNIKLAGEVSKTTIEGIRRTLQEGMEAGESIQQLTKRIQEASEFSSVRSELISRTESAEAFTMGEIKGWEASGQVKSVRWLLSPNACPHCQELASQVNSVPLGEPFVKKGETFNGVKYDYRTIYSPPLHCRCTCDLTAQLKE